MTKLAKPWSQEDDHYLQRYHGTMMLAELATAMGRSRASLRGRVTRLGIAKKERWSAEEEAALRALYSKAGRDGVLGLEEFSRSIGREASNVNRKAKELGFETNPRRKVVETRKPREDKRKYRTEEELSAARSEALRQRHALTTHPMKGRHHSPEARAKISRASKASQLMRTPEQQSEITLKGLKTKAANGFGPPQVARGSWKAGWRDIGGKRNFYRSRWEANYARYLQWLKEKGQIVEWQHEPETFWFEAVRRGVRSYKPDFRVWENNGRSDLHEVKGWMDTRSKTCLRRMAKYHPHERVVLIDAQQYRAIRLKVMGLIEGWEDTTKGTP